MSPNAGHIVPILAVVVGMFVLRDGIVEVRALFANEAENRVVATIAGVVGVIVGTLLVAHPTHALTDTGVLIGVWLVSAGVSRLVCAIETEGHTLTRDAVALAHIAAGVAVVTDPHLGYAPLAVLTSIRLTVNGTCAIVLALAIRATELELSTPPQPPGQSFG